MKIERDILLMKKGIAHVIFSNQLEELACALYEDLFSFKDPFLERLVIVPDVKVKNYLYHYFASDTKAKVAFGFQALTLQEGMQRLIGHKGSGILPTRLDFSFKIEEKIAEALVSTDSLYLPLIQYVGKAGGLLTSVQRKKIVALADEVAHFFCGLSLQPRSAIELWLKNSGWQQMIWRDIFSEMPSWTLLEDVIDKLAPSIPSVFLFAFTFLPEVYYKLFSQIDARWYVLSASEYFLEDLMSDKERVFLQKILEGKKTRLKALLQLDFYLRDTNPLIGNWGKVGRELIKQLSAIEPFIEERYNMARAPTLLAWLQNDLLYLSEKEHPYPTHERDSSLEIHACSSMQREVEVLSERLLCLLAEDEGLTPSDILVLTPSLASYHAIIHQVFSRLSIGYKILDTRQEDEDEPLVAMQKLLALGQRRFSLEAILELFSSAAFCDAMGWDGPSLSIIKRWIHQAGMTWGYDAEQRSAFLGGALEKGELAPRSGTWKSGMDRLIAALVYAHLDVEDVTEGFLSPLHCLDWSEAELFGQLHQVLSLLADDIEHLERFEASFASWCELLTKIRTRYLSGHEGCPFLKELRRINPFFSRDTAVFSLQSFQRVLSFALLKKRSSYRGSDLSSITFCSYEEGAVIPSKVIALLGMQEDSFPRKEIVSSLCDLSQLKKKAFVATKEEVDRYLFLQTILSARQRLIVSYTHISREDHKEMGPSSVIAELMDYVNGRRKETLAQLSITKHPSLSFHKKYFSGEGDGIHLFSERLYAAAQRYYSSERKSLQPLLSWQGCKAEVQQGPSLITIGQIQKFAKHPIKFFLQHVLGIYLPSLFRKEQKEYILPGYERIRLLKEGLVQPFQHVLAAAKAEGLMPLGAFEKVIEKRMYEENAQTKELLKDLGISSSQIQPLSLMHEGQPLIVEGPSGALYHLQGRLEGVCPRGLIVQGDDTASDLVTIWPLYLIFLSLVEARPEQGKDLILTKASTTLSLDVERPRLLLGAYLDYFMQSQKSPSFLMPMWAESILTANIKEFTKKMAKKEFLEVAPFPDDYLRWVFLRDPPLTEEVFYSFYERVVPHAFSPLVKHLRES